MSRWSRNKGARIEREIVAVHAELGIAGERVPLSGSRLV
jgi:Holliday junction resolvase